MSYEPSSMEMDEKFQPSFKVYDRIFNFMTMSCLLWLIVLPHLSKVTKGIPNYRFPLQLQMNHKYNHSFSNFFECL